MTPVKVKICGITRPADSQAAVAAGADALGFVFAPRSKRKLPLEEAVALVGQVPAFVSRVGLFMDQSSAEVARVLERAALNLLQFHGCEDAGFCRQFGLPYIKAVAMESAGAAEQAGRDFPDAAALLLDSHRVGQVGGTGQTFDWGTIPRLPLPLVLAGGLTPVNVRRAVQQVRPWAVDVSSGVEDAPGVKNAEKMRMFIREAKHE
jgi:phosphoribosylanthranilate isomerase